jgi:hypothetical protein
VGFGVAILGLSSKSGDQEVQLQSGGSADVQASVVAALKAQQDARDKAEVSNCPSPEEVWNECSGKGQGPNGETYLGQWKNDKYYGSGIYKYADGSRYEGDWVDSKFEGHGVFYYTDGTSYQGELLNNNKVGYGRKVDINGNIIEEGLYVDDKL